MSRILGLIREQVFAALFGASMQMDAFVVAFRIPNLLRDLFAEGALSSAFVTVFTKYQTEKTEKESWQLVNNVITTITIIISIITLFGFIFSKNIVLLIAPHFKDTIGKLELTVLLTDIMLPFLLLVSLASIFQGLLNTKKYFFIPAFSSSMFNLGSIVVGGGLALILPYFGYTAIIGMAIGTLAGGLFQLIIQLPLSFKVGFKFNFYFNLMDEGLRKIFFLIIPSIIGLSATQITIFVNTNFASSCGEGAISWLNYSFRLMQFPIGLFGVAVSIATLPVISRFAAEKNIIDFRKSIESALCLVFFLTIPATFGLFILAEPIIKVIYEYGRFTNHDTLMTARLLQSYSLGMVAYCGVKILVPAFYALNDTKWPVIGSFLGVLLNIIIILSTIDNLRQDAIALSTSVTMLFNFAFLLLILIKKIGLLNLKKIFYSLSKTFVASLIMGVICYLIYFEMIKFQSKIAYLFSLIVIIIISILCYIFISYFFKQDEIKVFVDKIKMKIKR